MEKILQQITATLREITPESYYRINPKTTLVYPYLTFDMTLEELGRNQEGATLDIDIFGKGSSSLDMVRLEEALKDALKYRRDLTADLNLTYSFRNSLDIPTQVDDLNRRNLTFYIKIDERKKQYGTS